MSRCLPGFGFVRMLAGEREVGVEILALRRGCEMPQLECQNLYLLPACSPNFLSTSCQDQ